MTFDEFKYKALHPKECDGAGIYRVRLINYETQSEYPLIECDVVFESFFSTYEEALKSITAYSYSKTSRPYCGFISYHKYGENSQSGCYNKLWLFDPNGKLIDESLSPGTTECHYTPFRGRPQNLVRFKIGEIIEVIDLFSNTSSLAIIARPPLSIEQAWDINLRNNKKTVEGQED